MPSTRAQLRPLEEEVASAAIQGAAAVASAAGLIYMVIRAWPRLDALGVAALVVYGASMFIAFLTSALYHGVQHQRVKPILQQLDHCTIFFLIAGTYAPVALLPLRHHDGLALLASVWSTPADCCSIAGTASRSATPCGTFAWSPAASGSSSRSPGSCPRDHPAQRVTMAHPPQTGRSQASKVAQMLLGISARVWAFVRDVGSVLAPCRFSLLVVMAGGTLLLAMPQGRELLVRLPDDGSTKVVLFYLCVFIWAFQSWYWARFILDRLFGADRQCMGAAPPRPVRIHFLIEHLPRVIAALAYGVAIVPCLLTGKSAAIWIGLGLLLQGVLFYRLLVRRRSLTVALIARFPHACKPLLTRSGPRADGSGGLAPLSRAIFCATLISAAALMAWAWASPVGLGWFLGSGAVTFLGFSMIVPVGSLAVYWSRQGGVARLAEEAHQRGWPDKGYPVVTALVLVPLVFSLWLDNHRVSQLNQEASQSGSSLADTVDRWREQAPSNADGSVDVVLVATAGGGIRAAYWTATVLGAVQDRVPAFRQQLLGVSGVSGGSLGASVFVTLLSQQHLPDRYSRCGAQTGQLHRDASWTRGPYECAGQTMLSQDFLAPVATATLFTDLIQRFIPVAFLPDRARALEQAWEQAWPRAQFEKGTWSDHGFDELWPRQGHLPSLLLNGTHVETGKRIITSNLVIHATDFPDAYDFFDLLPGTIRPSTAVLNSARFPYVSPAGTLGPNGRIVDGAYFENFGAETARDLLRATLAHFRHEGVVAHPVVILITSDPDLMDDEMPGNSGQTKTGQTLRAAGLASSWADEILTPIRALLHTRGAHGIRAAHDLAAVVGQGGRLFHFRLCPGKKASEPALGWVLSSQSEALMREQLHTDDCANAAQLESLVQQLKTSAGGL
jgi:hypothetical protein